MKPSKNAYNLCTTDKPQSAWACHEILWLCEQMFLAGGLA